MQTLFFFSFGYGSSVKLKYYIDMTQAWWREDFRCHYLTCIVPLVITLQPMKALWDDNCLLAK